MSWWPFNKKKTKPTCGLCGVGDMGAKPGKLQYKAANPDTHELELFTMDICELCADTLDKFKK